MTKKVLINKQGKAIINKHHNKFSNLTPDEQLGMFRHIKDENNEDVYLKGEIVIDTDPENPSIYILNNNNKVVKISGNGSDGEGSYDDTEIKQLIKVVSDDIKEVSDDLNVLRGSDIDKSVRTIAEEVLTNGVDLSEITENIDKLNELIGETSVESQINTKIGELPNDKTIVDLINEETSNRTNAVEDIQNQINVVTETYATLDNVNTTKTELESKFATTQNILDGLIGDDNNKTVRNIATDEATKAVANVINGAPEAYDTLQEIANWIIGGEGVSGVTAADMLISIQKNAEDIANEVAKRKETVDNVQSAVDDIKKDYLTSGDKTELSNAITAETNTRIESIDNLQREINTIKSDYLKDSDKKELSNSINDVVDVVTNHTETILSIQDSVNTFRGDFDKNVESVDTSINNITTDINSINSELDNIDTTLENINNDITNINTNISGITETIETINSEIVVIKEDVSNKHAETNSVISGITEEIGAINDNISTITINVGTIEENLTTTTSNVDDIINNQLPSINDSISGITTEVTNIKEEISGYTESINEISKTTSELNEKVDEAVTNFNTLSDTVSTFENTINTNTENINTLLTNVSANTETLNVLTGDEEGSINKKINDTKAEIDTYTVNGISISQSPTFTSGNLYISEDYQIIGDNGNIVDEGRIIPKDKLTKAFVKLESMLLTTTLAITASLNDLEARIGNPSQYDEEGNLIKESNGLFKRIEDLEK